MKLNLSPLARQMTAQGPDFDRGVVSAANDALFCLRNGNTEAAGYWAEIANERAERTLLARIAAEASHDADGCTPETQGLGWHRPCECACHRRFDR